MSSSGVHVKLQPRTAPCHAVTAWHSEAALLVCSFEYGAELARPRATIAERIDAALGISTTPPRALLGDLEVTWHDESRLHSIELRTGQTQWERSSLAIPSEGVEQSSMTFRLEYDVNRIASVDLEVRVLWDVAEGRLGLRFGKAEPKNPRWLTVADTVFVCVDDVQTLIELRFADVEIVSDRPC
jgi:hypothetical protein